MNILGYKLIFLVLVTFCYNLDKTCAQNPSKMLIPIIATKILGPRKFERIIVPVYPTLSDPYDDEKPVTEKVIDIENTSEESKSVEHNRRQKSYNDKGNNRKSYSYVTRADGYSRKPLKTTKHEVDGSPNEIQPLHIDTKVFKKTQPDHSEQTVAEKKKKFEDQEEKLKIDNLPENPQEVPQTDWFDNLGKYNYGIVHDSQQDEETASVEDSTENESKEIPKEAIPVIQHPQVVTTKPNNPSTFKSGFSDPNSLSQVHQQNNNDGKFLYKSEVYFPNYRDHLYLPVTTYYGDQTVFPKHYPVFKAHTVYHTPQNVQHGTVNQHTNVQNVPIKVPLSIPTVKTTKSPPKKVYSPQVQKTLPPTVKHPLPIKKTVEKTAPPPKQQQSEEDDENEEEEDGKTENYDYEEGDSVEDEEDGSNDKYRGDSSEDYDEEEQEEETPKYSYDSKNSFNARSDEKSNEDDFDKAWKKYGYGPNEASLENESSESRLVPEIAPGRKKIVHMKMEYYKAPHDGIDVDESASNVENIEILKPSRQINSKMSGTINNNKDKKRKKNKGNSAKSQQQHPNAGPDDLKFFQYFNYLGNGEHRAGGRVGNDKHYIEQHERGSEVAGAFQKKVKWADKEGGFGEHYWDLNHGK